MTDSALHHITGSRRRCTTCGQPQNAPVHSVPAPRLVPVAEEHECTVVELDEPESCPLCDGTVTPANHEAFCPALDVEPCGWCDEELPTVGTLCSRHDNERGDHFAGRHRDTPSADCHACPAPR